MTVDHAPTSAARAISPLSSYADRLAGVEAASGGLLTLMEIPFVTMLTVWSDVNASDPGVSDVELLAWLGVDASPATGHVARSDGRPDVQVLGLGPDEWLVLGPPGCADDLIARSHSVAGCSVVDVSAARTTVRIGGPAARELLAHGCALDLDPRVFGPGSSSGRECAQTMLARANVVLLAPPPSDDAAQDDAITVLVRSSFAAYLADWLLDAALEIVHSPSAG